MLAFKYRTGKELITRDGLKDFCKRYDLHWSKATFMFRVQRKLKNRWAFSEGLWLDGVLHNMICLARGTLSKQEYLDYHLNNPQLTFPLDNFEWFQIISKLGKR